MASSIRLGASTDRQARIPGLLWILAFSATTGIAWMVNLGPVKLGSQRLQVGGLFGASVVLGALAASSLQVLLLRRCVHRPRAWIGYSMLGALLGYGAFAVVGTRIPSLIPCSLQQDSGWWGTHEVCSAGQELLRDLVVYAPAGLVLGLVQLVPLRRWVEHAWIVVPSSAAALAIAGALFPVRELPDRSPETFWKLWLAGAAGGLIKAAVMAYLLNVHRKRLPATFLAPLA